MSDRSPRHAFGLRFSLLARRWRRTLSAELAAQGLSDAIWLPLVHLKEAGGDIWQKDLAQLVGVDASSLVRVLDILERQGLIERQPDPADRRARRIVLTETGRARVEEIRAQLQEIEERMLVDLGDDEIAGMLERVARIEARIEAMAKSETEE